MTFLVDFLALPRRIFLSGYKKPTEGFEINLSYARGTQRNPQIYCFDFTGPRGIPR